MLCSVSTALLLLDREPAGPKLHKSSIYQQHFLAVDTPAYFVFRSSNFIYLFFYVKVHHTSPAKPLESTSPDNIQKSAHIGTFRKGGREGGGGYKADLCAACANCALYSVTLCGTDESLPNSPR